MKLAEGDSDFWLYLLVAAALWAHVTGFTNTSSLSAIRLGGAGGSSISQQSSHTVGRCHEDTWIYHLHLREEGPFKFVSKWLDIYSHYSCTSYVDLYLHWFSKCCVGDFQYARRVAAGWMTCMLMTVSMVIQIIKIVDRHLMIFQSCWGLFVWYTIYTRFLTGDTRFNLKWVVENDEENYGVYFILALHKY